MRILLVGNYAPDRQESMQRFVATLQQGYRASGHDVRTTQPAIRCGRLTRLAPSLGKWLGYIDKLLLFPGTLEKECKWAELVHICDHSNAFYVTATGARPTVVTCHDLLAIRSARGDLAEHRTRWSGRVFQRLILSGLRKSAVIACVSQKTRDDLVGLLGEDDRLITVIYNGLNYAYSRMSDEEAAPTLEKYGIAPDSNYLMHVGGNQWYKNRLGALTIFSELLPLQNNRGLHLAMVGEPFDPPMREFVEKHGLNRTVIEISNADNEDLRALYSRSAGLLFPSFYEGFGWPIIEAQACGCRVFTTNQPPMNEIGGKDAVYIDPGDPTGAAATIADALSAGNGDQEERIRHAGFYSTGRMIEHYLDLYRSLTAPCRKAGTTHRLNSL